MTNLPRKLVYTDKTSLSDFMENELFREIHDVLLGFLRLRNGYFSPVASDVYEKEILDIFNHATYFTILAAHDAGAMRFFYNFDKYGSAYQTGFQVALVILALQKEKNGLVRKVLKRFMASQNSLLNSVFEKFLIQGRLLCMDLSPCPPPIGQLDMDWEEVTEAFNGDRVLKILSLWKTKDEKKKVLHDIWSSAMALQGKSSHSEASMYINMLRGALEDGDGVLVDAATFYATVIGGLNKENAALKEEKAQMEGQPAQGTHCDAYWVRKVVDYAKDRQEWPEAKPFRDMLNHLLRGSGNEEIFAMVDEIEEHFRREKKQGMNIAKTETFINQAEKVIVMPQEQQPPRKQLS